MTMGPPEPEPRKMEKLVQKMMTDVKDFHEKITHRPMDNEFPGQGNFDHLAEEVREAWQARGRGDRAGVIDGLIDLVYVALGALLEMGIPPSLPFDEVHRANMTKVPKQTDRYGPGVNDAVKPDGFVSPDHATMLEHLEILHKVSPVFVELTKLRIKKGNNYNRGNVKRSDHFPLGDLSYFQMVWLKMCRVRSMVENPNEDSKRLIERELNDIMVYSCFWAEYMRGLDL